MGRGRIRRTRYGYAFGRSITVQMNAGWVNEPWLRSASYVAAGIACVAAGFRETSSERTDRWPRFWYVAAAILAVLALGRITGFASWMYDRGKQGAVSGGWYWSRRPIQAIAVAALAVLTLFTALAAGRRLGARARRFLLPAACLLALVALAATRLVSLHQVDTLLYRRPISGARIASLVDLLGPLVVAITALVATQLPRNSTR